MKKYIQTIFKEYINENKIEDKILINGEYKSTINSDGNYISNNMEGIYNFYEWFGDSKLVDKNGNPLVVYHGTSKIFNVFKPTIFGKLGEGSYFTSIKNSAEYYAKRYGSDNVMSVYLKIENLAIISNSLAKKELPINYDGILALDLPNGSGYVNYDYIFSEDMSENEIFVFTSNQIKSVDNDGTFDITDDNIYS